MNMLQDENIDIAGICETWLADANSPITATIKIHGYSILHHFRSDSRGGGTALIYKSCYTMTAVPLSSNCRTFEFTAAMIKTIASTKVLFIIIYRTGPITSAFNGELDHLLSEAAAKCDTIVLAGDMNIHFDLGIKNGLVSQTLDVLSSYGMVKHINNATHVNGGSLDQIFTFSMDNKLAVSHTIDHENSLGSDHFPIFCKFNITVAGKYFKAVEYRLQGHQEYGYGQVQRGPGAPCQWENGCCGYKV